MDESLPMATPASSARLLAGLAGRLREAARDGDWTALARVDAEIAEQLRGYDALRASADERASWGALRHAHEQAMQDCQRESRRLRQAIEQMVVLRQGWLAYAESQTWQAPPLNARGAP